MGNVDPTPAIWVFEVDLEAPKATIESGPSGETSDPQPEFGFSADDPHVTFECRFDSETFGPCAGPATHRPATALTRGAHRFAVRAIDRAGNIGPEAARDFMLIGSPSGGQHDEGAPAGKGAPGSRGKGSQARIKLGKPKLNRQRGIAILPVRVSAAGRLRLLGNKRVRPVAMRTKHAATIRLRVMLRRKFARQLDRRGRLTVRLQLRFKAAKGGRAAKSRKLTLRRSGRSA